MDKIKGKLLAILKTYTGKKKITLSEEERMSALGRAKIGGTTILALKFKEGVVMAADRRCVSGEAIFSDNEIKIEELDNLTCIAGAGLVSDFQLLVDILREQFIPSLQKFWDVEIFVDGQAKLLKYIMRNTFLLTWPILGGFDPYENTGRIFLYEPGGAIFEFENYAACGSGEEGARGILEQEWSKDCTEAKGIRIAIKALLAASKIDRNTSNSLIRVPLVKIISSEKITDVPKEKCYQIAWGIIAKEEVRKGIADGPGAFIANTILDWGNEEKKETGK
jgi:proteasome beta subunit